jgi:hypothetical protein
MARSSKKRPAKTVKERRRGNGSGRLEAVCCRGEVPPWVPRATAVSK